MVGALMLLAVLAAMLAGALGMSVDNSEATVRRVDRFEGKRTASSVNRLTAQSIWSSYEATLADGNRPRVLELRLHLDGLGLVNQAGMAPDPIDMVDQVGLATNGDGDFVLGDAVVESVRVHREDSGRNTRLHVTTVAHADEGGEEVRETLTDIFDLGAPTWNGLDFTLLASNVNCIMCHTTVDDVRRVYAIGDAVEGGGRIRARLGAIESFQIRHDPESLIAGTLYLGQNAIDEHGDPITDWSAFTLEAMALDGDGSVEQDGFGNPTVVGMSPADEDDPQPFANLYTNYLAQEDPVDGKLPDSFPLPFTDDGGFDPATGAQDAAGEGNRIIDDLEFETTVATFTGSISGGSVGLVAPGDAVVTAGEARTLASGNAAGLGAVTSGNVVLTGTPSDPIRIDGRVAIDGDLIISGPIEGLGSLWVRGNVYVRGDLVYDDIEISGQRAFGTGTDGPNALGLTAGGNIVMGDMFRGQWGDGTADGTASGAWNFTLEQAALFNRGEWLKTQAELPGQPQYVQVGTEIQTREIKEQVTNTYLRDVKEWQPNGDTWERPIYESVQTGTQDVPVYETVVHNPGTPYERSETVQTGTQTVPVYESIQVGTETLPVYEQVVVGQETVTATSWVSKSPPEYEDVEVAIHEWQTPSYPNPDYQGADYVPRFYSFDEGAPVPIPTGDGYFDPDAGRWVAPEMVNGWDAAGLTLADPSDPSDPHLNPSGSRSAVIETLTPKADWISDEGLQALIGDALAARNPNDPLMVDATVYSSNSIFGVVPDDPAAGTSGKLRVQGSLLAADIGLLGPNGTEINYDPRGREVLQILDEDRLGLRVVGTVPAAKP